MTSYFRERMQKLERHWQEINDRKNRVQEINVSGAYERYEHPVLTAAHVPLCWRYDFNPATNPWLLERIGVNSVLNAGAIKWKDKYLVIARMEGVNRKSFFAIAESDNGIDGFQFREKPVIIPSLDKEETNLYDIRLTAHEDGFIYGLFCTEKKDPAAIPGDESAAIAQCGIVRTKDLINWERLQDLTTRAIQQRNVVLHPEFVNNQYAFYTRPQDNFIEAGKGGGIGMGFADSMERAVINEESIIDPKIYHTVSELKNGQGPAPIKTEHGWLHLAHGVRNTAAGLRYVLYVFMTDLRMLTKVIYKPAGYFLAPEGGERVGDVSNVVFCNGWIADPDGKVFIYYASSDTRLHVATSSIDVLLDYVMNTPADGFTSAASVTQVCNLIEHNNAFTKQV